MRAALKVVFLSVPFWLGTAAANECRSANDASSITICANATGLTVSLDANGAFEVATRSPAWKFSGSVGSSAAGLLSRPGRDTAGSYQQVEFRYKTSNGAARLGSIRVYDRRNVILFKTVLLTSERTPEPFPSISSYPEALHHLTYTSTFGGFDFEHFGPDGPWLFFDDQANAFIFSPASHYMNAELSFGPRNELLSRITTDAQELPSRYVEMAVLVVEPGINRAFETWGRFLTDLTGKKRPGNEADFSLKYLGYWTDHGGQYYYRFEEGLGYAGTLLKVRDEFQKMNIRLGYVQLDSWFYPKGHEGKWKSTDPLGGGTYRYEAAKELFPKGLRAFQRKLGVPLIVHNRWIDESSPYRKEYSISGNVATDPRLWNNWMRYLRTAGVRTYEQDWLSGPAMPRRDLDLGERFMDTMAMAARKQGISLQYCMPLPRHFLQGTRYSNLLTIRTSGDRLTSEHWKSFLFNGRLASALGEWPWTDVFMSSETSNLLLSTLSASMVGIGDAVGTFDQANLRRVVRSDGVIVKPDEPIRPLDAAYLEEASGQRQPIIASAATHHEGSNTSYVFAFAQAPENQTRTFSPAALGYEGPVYAYNYFERYGLYLRRLETATFEVPDRGSYWIVVPVGASGVGFLGDDDKFVSNGRHRIASISDTGTLSARVIFARGESRLHLHAFSLAHPMVHTRRAIIENATYDAKSGLFSFDLVAAPGTFADVTLRAAPERADR